MTLAPVRRRLSLLVATAAAVALTVGTGSSALAKDAYPPTPDVACDKGSLPETTQGRASLADVNSGRAAKGYTCNARKLGHYGTVGGFRVTRYVDAAGHECGYYDTTLLIGRDALKQGIDGTGVYVMDMTDPSHPTYLKTLATAAMDSPHESLRLNAKRGLLVAVLSTPAAAVGQVDVYDVSADCRNPVLKSSTPFGVLGHESGFSPDGLTFYISSLYLHTLAAIALDDPSLPQLLWVSYDYQPHGMSVSDDGKRLYIAEAGFNSSDFSGLTILDTSAVQARTLNPSVPLVSRTTWPNVGTPQYAEPFTQHGHKFLMEIDEYGSGVSVGAGRILDMTNEKSPKVISNMRLQVNQEANQASDQASDPGASLQFQGYRGHYCSIATRVDPTMVACTFINSGLRVFDITKPSKPQEIAYYNGPIVVSPNPILQGAFAMAAPVIIPSRREIWYSDGNLGFFAVRLTAAAKRNPALDVAAPSSGSGGGSSAGSGSGSGHGGGLATTGLSVGLPVAGLLFLGVAIGVRVRRRAAS
ncbi:MAG: hypothetical protein QOJ92_603 [Frankiales bacterium]|nr:hypothetical protein [Frankiales bacterium]